MLHRHSKLAHTGSTHFITTVTEPRRAWFTSDEICRVVLEVFEYYRAKFAIDCLGYVLMPDHLHSLLYQKMEGDAVQKLMESFKRLSAKKLQALGTINGPLWRRRYDDVPVPGPDAKMVIGFDAPKIKELVTMIRYYLLFSVAALLVSLLSPTIAKAQIGIRWSSEEVRYYSPYRSAGSANLDGDPQDEIASTSGNAGSRQVKIFDALTGALEWESPIYHDVSIEGFVKVAADRSYLVYWGSQGPIEPATYYYVGIAGGLFVPPASTPPAPNEIKLQQNFPNPFNPNTAISYSISKTSHVTILVYNSLGQKVRELVNITQPAGSYTIEWDGTDASGSSLASGMYYYQIQSDGVLSTKKMVMLK